jgi:tRNA 2-thiouridine synthesizing protein A
VNVEVLDCRGQRCPLPIIAIARRMPELPVGTVLRVVCDDEAAALDIPAWCRMRGQEYLGTAQNPDLEGSGHAAGSYKPGITAKSYDIRKIG